MVYTIFHDWVDLLSIITAQMIISAFVWPECRVLQICTVSLDIYDNCQCGSDILLKIYDS